MAFDPDAYLAGRTATNGFDPDAYLAGEIPTYAPQVVTPDDVTPADLSNLVAPEGSPQREEINRAVAGNLFAPPGAFAREPTLAEMIQGLGLQPQRDQVEVPLRPREAPLPEQGAFEQGGVLGVVGPPLEAAEHVARGLAPRTDSWKNLMTDIGAFATPAVGAVQELVDAPERARRAYANAQAQMRGEALPFPEQLDPVIAAQQMPEGPEKQQALKNAGAEVAAQVLMGKIIAGQLGAARAGPSHLRAEPLAPEPPPTQRMGPGTTAGDVAAAIKELPPEVPLAERITQPRVEPPAPQEPLAPVTPEAAPPPPTAEVPAVQQAVVPSGGEVPLLTQATRSGSTIRMSFDAKGGVPTPEELTKQFSDLGHNVSVSKFKTDLVSATRGQVNYRVDVFDESSRMSSDLASQLMSDAFGADQPFRAQTQFEQAIPLQQRFAAAHDYGLRKMVGASAAREAEVQGVPEPYTPEAAAARAEQPAGAEPPPTPPVAEPIPQAYSDEPHVSAIANRFTAERAARGELGEIKPGESINTMDLVHQGLKMGPEEVNESISRIMQGGDVPINDAAAIRGEEARLSQRSGELSRVAHTSPEARLAADNAFKDLEDFHNGPVAQAKRNWHHQGKLMQGEIPVDLSTLNGMREAWLKDTGKAPPESVEPKLQKAADKLARAIDEERTAARRGGEAIDRITRGKKLPTYDEVRNNIAERMKEMPCT